MKRRLPRYCRSFVDRHGHTRHYFHRGGGKNIPLPGLPWGPRFMAAYEGARSDGKVAAINKTKAGSVDATVIAYLHSDGFANGLAKSTRGTRRRILTNFAKEHGDKPVAMMYAQALTNIIKKMTPANQRGFKKAMRGFIDYCLSHNLMKIDPLPSIKLDKMKDKGGFQPGKKTRSPHTKPDTREAPKPDWPWNCYCRPEPLDATW